MDCCFFEYVGFFVLVVIGVMFGMYCWQEYGMLVGMCIGLYVECDCFVDYWVDVIVNVVVQVEEIEVGFVVDQYCDVYFCFVDVGQCMIECVGWVGFDVGDVFVYFVWDGVCCEIRCVGGDWCFWFG